MSIDHDEELKRQIARTCKLLSESGMEHWWVNTAYTKEFYDHGFYIMAANYYVPLPTPEDIAGIDFEKEYFSVSALNYDEKFSLEWLKKVVAYHNELDGLIKDRSQSEITFKWSNDQFRGLDALSYYGMLRFLRPHRVIEIGCGNSTLIASMALAANKVGRITLIEPNPTRSVEALECEYELHKERVQDVDLALFEELESGDVLFIDSSHCAYTQSDVHKEIFDILPKLKSGVFVHFHDIFFPCEYPEPWIKAGWRWNEQYLLYAFLIGNMRARIILPNFLYWQNKQLSHEVLSALTTERQLGQSFWIKIE